MSPFPILGGYILHAEELEGKSLLQLPLFGLQWGRVSKKDDSEERTWLGMCLSSQRALEASLTGMEFNHNAHCGEALFWSKKKMTNKMTLRRIHLSNRISGLYFVWLRMEIPLLFQANLLTHQTQGWGFIQEKKFFLIYFMYLFLAVLGLCCCAWAFSSCGERELLFVVVCGLLTAVASLVAEHGLYARASVVVARGLQSVGSVVVAHGLSCSAACGIFPDQDLNPCPLHWQADS